jgi:hypothetical protein
MSRAKRKVKLSDRAHRRAEMRQRRDLRRAEEMAKKGVRQEAPPHVPVDDPAGRDPDCPVCFLCGLTRWPMGWIAQLDVHLCDPCYQELRADPRMAAKFREHKVNRDGTASPLGDAKFSA